MISDLANNLSYYNASHYAALKLPLKNITSNIQFHRYDLINKFDTSSLEINSEIDNLSKKSMLTPVLRVSKILY